MTRPGASFIWAPGIGSMIEDDIQNGERCVVIGGTHKGKSGTVEDRKLSKTGQVTITGRQADGARVKTLARNVRRPS